MVQPRTVVGPRPPENQLLQCFEFHDKHGRNRRKERICFDHELVRDQNKSLTARYVPSSNSKRRLIISYIYPGLKAYCYMITILLE